MAFKEDALQMAVARYLDYTTAIYTHVANERKTSPQAGARLKRKGVKSGVPDVLIFNKTKDFNGLAIELKVGKNKPTANQLDWLEKLKKENWQTAICYSFDEAQKVIDEYFN